MDEQYGAPPTIPQATGNPSMQSLLQMIQQREQERPTYAQQQQALQEYMNAVRNSQPLDDSPWHSMGRGFLSAPDASSPHDLMEKGFAQAGREIVNRNNLVQQDERARETASTKLKYDDIQKERSGLGGFGQGATTAIVQNTLDPFKNAPGVGMIDKKTGRVVLPASIQPQYEKRWEQNFKLAMEREAQDPNAWATQQTNAEFNSILQNPNIMGGRAQTPQAPTPTAAPQTDEAKLLSKIDELNKAAKQFGDNPMILKSVQQQMDETAAKLIELRKSKGQPLTNVTVPPGGEPGATVATPEEAPAPLAPLNKPAKAAAIKTAEGSAEMYTKSFDDNVVKPAAAFANTGKIMQDFNALGQMQTALKNGKIKEFMAGEGGRYLMPLLGENSDLRKGIANAQEADKLTQQMVNQILLAAKGVQTEGDAQRARSQVTSVGVDPDANAYIEAFVTETARQLQEREKLGLAYKQAKGTFEGYDSVWREAPIMKEARGSVKKVGKTWVGVSQYIEKFKAKNPGATDFDAIKSWNRVQS